MNASDYEIFYDWNNSIKKNDKMQFRSIQAKIKPLMERNFYSNSEIEEILIAEGYKEDLIKEAFNCYDEKNSEKDLDIKVEALSSIPKKYSDISYKFEKVLASQGPTKFIKLMTQGESPLVKISKKELGAFQKIADVAYENPAMLPALHAFLKPSIISELSENICRARKIRNKCSFAKISDGKYKIMHAGKEIEASIKPVNSTSQKYVLSNYGIFGFPDEFVFLAYEENSPEYKLKRDLES